MTQQQIQSFYDAAGSRDIDKFLSFFADDGVFKSVSKEETYRGKNELRGMVQEWMTAFPDGKFKINKLIGNGDTWCAEVSFTGTHQGVLHGPMGDINPTGKKVDVPSCDVITFKSGKVQSVNCYFAATVMLNQLGLMPMQKAA